MYISLISMCYELSEATCSHVVFLSDSGFEACGGCTCFFVCCILTICLNLSILNSLL